MHSTLGWTLFQTGDAWPGVEGSMPLLGVIVLAGLGTGVLFAMSLFAYLQRRTTRYLLVTIAVGALFGRSVIGIGTVFGLVSMPIHHLIEHSLDFLIAAVILYAVVRNKPAHFDSPPDEVS